VTSENQFQLPNGVDIAALPKISLHDHLDGGVRPQTIIELADAVGVDVPETDSAKLAAWFLAQCDAGNLVDYLKTFDLTTAVMQTEEGLARVAREFVQDLAADGVVYGEVRWAPEQHLTRGLSLDQVVEAVQEGLDQGVEDAERAGRGIQVGQLVTAMRHADRGLEIAELAVRHRGNGVVGFDIAGAEAGFPASRHRVAFDFLAQEYLPVTVHAGEADGIDSIKSALFDGRALRLGHGVRIMDDITLDENGEPRLGRLAAYVRDTRIPLEMCPTSNVHTGAASSIADHPIGLLARLRFRVTVNTDNRLMSGCSTTSELLTLAQAFDYGWDDLRWFTINAMKSAFCHFDYRLGVIDDVIKPGFAALQA
jgi:adenosine deaminase